MRKYLALPVHMKLSYARQIKTENRNLLREQMKEEEDGNNVERLHRLKEKKVQPSSSAPRKALIKRGNIKKESTLDYITKQQEIFRQEYCKLEKQREIKRLEDAFVTEERKLKQAEQELEDTAHLFEEYLKENEQKAVEAIKIAEQETKSKQEKIAEIKRLNNEIWTIKREISKDEETLREYKVYKDFLYKLSPPEWQEAQRAKALESKVLSEKDVLSREKYKETESKSGLKPCLERKASGCKLPPIGDPRLSSRQSIQSLAQSKKLNAVSKLDSSSMEFEDEPELYFSEPQQLLDLLTQLKEQVLFLMENCAETEEALGELHLPLDMSKKKMAQNEEQLTSKISIMTENIEREQERVAELKLKVDLFNNCKLTTDQDRVLEELGRKVEEVYRCCVADKKGKLTAVQMLEHIEAHVFLLLENLEGIRKETLERAVRLKNDERRVKQQEEKLQQQRDHQQERLRKASERAHSDIKKTSGKKLMLRSKPIVQKVKFDKVKNIAEKDDIDAYFFS
ncbi:cilia- and flagella-associated protein 100 isoform X2 [Lampris incognitus]|nr:cilia- and flagella-associated protein 100 isoform X2 [Lampris incognitus]